MKPFKYLKGRIRGWLPKEPYLPRNLNSSNSQNKKAPRISLRRVPLGLKLVVALFWIFGFGAILTLIEQATQLGYLPLNAQFLMATVTAIDGVALFVVGAGLLTMRKRWVDAAIVFSAISLVAFYIVPLRFALPLEAVVLVYLVTLRKGVLSAKVIQVAPAALLVVLCGASFTPVFAINANAQIINPSKALIKSISQTSRNNGFSLTVNVYQYADLDSKEDYYFLEMDLLCPLRNFNHVAINASIENVTIVPPWTPQASPSSQVAIAFGVAAFYIGNPRTSKVYTSPAGNISWEESSLNLEKSETFSTDLWVSQGAHFSATILAEVGFNDKVFGNLWVDKLDFGVVEI
jgi:hypothetical protein